MTVEIQLTRGRVALIDDQDAELVCRYKWQTHRARGVEQYAVVGRLHLYMHRLIMGAELGDRVKHKNGNGFDNRRENLLFDTPNPVNVLEGGVAQVLLTQGYAALIDEQDAELVCNYRWYVFKTDGVPRYAASGSYGQTMPIRLSPKEMTNV